MYQVTRKRQKVLSPLQSSQAIPTQAEAHPLPNLRARLRQLLPRIFTIQETIFKLPTTVDSSSSHRLSQVTVKAQSTQTSMATTTTRTHSLAALPPPFPEDHLQRTTHSYRIQAYRFPQRTQINFGPPRVYKPKTHVLSLACYVRVTVCLVDC